jgi:hypothetical protein
VTGYNLYEGSASGGENYSVPVNGKTLITDTATTVTGLVNAKTYYFTVKALNAVGTSPASNEAFAIPAATVPAAPTHVLASAGDAYATITWEVPSSLGGSNITGYAVTAADSTASNRGGETCAWTSGPLTCTVSGVANGDSYTFTATATNSLGTSVASAVSNVVVPAITVPSVPTDATATPGNGVVAVSWTAPFTGGSAIAGYNLYEGTTSGGENPAPVNGKTLITATSTTVTGLSNGHKYFFTIKAVNATGSSASSSEVWAIPAGSVPGAPTHAAATSGYESATVIWTAPSNIGGSAISRYTVTAHDSTVPGRGGQSCTWTSGILSCALTGLTDGDSYSFGVTATNSVGTSVASVASTAIVPALSVPSAPGGLIATPNNNDVVLSWIAPIADNGATLVGYNVYEGSSPGGENYSAAVNGAILINGTTSVVDHLINGHTYYFTVKAANAVGSSVSSDEAWAIPDATVADAPQNVSAAAGSDLSAVVSWSAPLKSGGSAITGYVVTSYIGAAPQRVTVLEGTSSTGTVTGLSPGNTYSFTVAAANASGNGPQSAPSNLVTWPRAITTLALSFSAARVVYGHEQVERFSVAVAPKYPGPIPGGTILVKKSTTTLCVVTLSSGKGSCSLASAVLPPRLFSVYATYAPNANFVGSTSPKLTLRVTRATTRTSMKLSVARVTYGHEVRERLSVVVSPEFRSAMPTGPVTISGRACHLNLSSGKGSCTLSAKKFRMLSHLVATYWGSTRYSGSVSASHTLTIDS